MYNRALSNFPILCLSRLSICTIDKLAIINISTQYRFFASYITYEVLQCVRINSLYMEQLALSI